MQVVINKVDDPWVEFSCHLGKGIGLGIGYNKFTDFEVNEELDIELDIEPLLDLGTNTSYSDDLYPFIDFDDDHLYINAIAESVDELNYVVLRLSEDCVIMTEASSNEIVAGDYLHIKLERSELLINIVGY